jgi:PilZ domain
MIRHLRKWLSARPWDEKRRSERRAIQGEVIVNTADGRVHRGISRNVSETGLAAIVYGSLDVGVTVQLRYEHPESGHQARTAIVRNRHGYKHGFEFARARA